MNAIKILRFLTVSVLFCSCGPSIKVTQIGKLNMISERNIDTKTDYTLLRSYMGGSEKEIKQSTSKTIEEATNETVKNTPGGEFLKNVKLYLVAKGSELFYAVEGDVWGVSGTENFRGFRVGDKVQWRDGKGNHTGKITSLKDSKECLVREDGKTESKPISYEKITKISED
jgi:hypothetical protein